MVCEINPAQKNEEGLVETVTDNVRESRISELLGSLKKNWAAFAKLKETFVYKARPDPYFAHMLNSLAASLADLVKKVAKQSRVFTVISRNLRITTVISIPVSVWGMHYAGVNMRHKNHDKKVEARIHFAGNLSWFMDSVATILSGLEMVEKIPLKTRVVLGAASIPFAAVGAVFGLVVTFARAKAAIHYEKEQKNLSKVSDINDINQTFGLKDYQPDESHIENFKKRYYSLSLTHKLYVLSAVISVVATTALIALSSPVVPMILFVSVGLIELSAFVIDKRGDYILKKSIGQEVDKLNYTVFVISSVALVAFPLLMVSCVL